MSNFFDSLSDTFGQTDTENLKKVASQIGGNFKSSGVFNGQQITVEYSQLNKMG